MIIAGQLSHHPSGIIPERIEGLKENEGKLRIELDVANEDIRMIQDELERTQQDAEEAISSWEIQCKELTEELEQERSRTSKNLGTAQLL